MGRLQVPRHQSEYNGSCSDGVQVNSQRLLAKGFFPIQVYVICSETLIGQNANNRTLTLEKAKNCEDLQRINDTFILLPLLMSVRTCH